MHWLTGEAQDADRDFVVRSPGYAVRAPVDALRVREYGRVYRHYTGGALYAETQIEPQMRTMRGGV